MRGLLKFTSLVLLGASLGLIFAGALQRLAPILGQANLADSWQQLKAGSSTSGSGESPRPLAGDAIAVLKITRLETEMFVVEGTGTEQLRRGPGHLSESALPGTPGNCVIAAHRDTHFRVLKEIRGGDEIVLETRRGYFTYRVTTVKVVSPDDTGPIQPASSPVLNLITCYPFFYVGPAPKRFVVTAEPIETVTTHRVG